MLTRPGGPSLFGPDGSCAHFGPYGPYSCPRCYPHLQKIQRHNFWKGFNNFRSDFLEIFQDFYQVLWVLETPFLVEIHRRPC